jgi:hypothetical protein
MKPGCCGNCGGLSVIVSDMVDLDAPVLCSQCGSSLGSRRAYEKRLPCPSAARSLPQPSSSRGYARPGSDLRSAVRTRCLLRGRVVFNARSATVECTVRDISPKGAKLLITDSVTVPDVFELEFPKTGARRRAKRVWNRSGEWGVQFVA